MDQDAIRIRAKHLDNLARIEMANPFFRDVIAWLVYLGLLRHSEVEGRRCHVTLQAMLQAGALEPRVLEVLPALLVRIPEAVRFDRREIPPDLKVVLAAIKQGKAHPPFRGIPAGKYLHWLNAAAMELAAKRLRFRALPRARSGKVSELAKVISEGRIERTMTQKQLSEAHGLSLRVIRDLEQGKLTASLQNVSDVLSALGRKLTVV